VQRQETGARRQLESPPDDGSGTRERAHLVLVRRNHLLRSIEPDDLAALRPHLHPFRLRRGAVLEQPDTASGRVCFLDRGMASVFVQSGNHHRIEVAMIGYEGVIGISEVLGVDQSPYWVEVLIEGSGNWISSTKLRAAINNRPGLQRLFALYAQAFAAQMAHTTLATGRAALPARLARWLCMASDRCEESVVPVTHESLARALGVRRAGVSETLAVLEGHQLLRATRGAITIKDRLGLIEAASGFYGAAEAAYSLLPGAMETHSDGRSSSARGAR
jgi:CRP-like cAMP-binding protein